MFWIDQMTKLKDIRITSFTAKQLSYLWPRHFPRWSLPTFSLTSLPRLYHFHRISWISTTEFNCYRRFIMSLVHGQFLHVGRGAKLQICQKLVPQVLSLIKNLCGEVLASLLEGNRNVAGFSILFNYSRYCLNVPTTQPSFIEWQSILCRSPPPPTILDKKTKKQPQRWLYKSHQ